MDSRLSQRLIIGLDTVERDIEHTVDASNMALEIVLAPEEASAHVAGEARR